MLNKLVKKAGFSVYYYGKTNLVYIVGTFVIDYVEYLLFSGEEKRSKKVVGTLATVSQTPQRF